MTFCLFQAEPQWLWISSLAFYPGQRSDHTRKWWLLGSVVVFVDKSCCNAIDCDVNMMFLRLCNVSFKERISVNVCVSVSVYIWVPMKAYKLCINYALVYGSQQRPLDEACYNIQLMIRYTSVSTVSHSWVCSVWCLQPKTLPELFSFSLVTWLLILLIWVQLWTQYSMLINYTYIHQLRISLNQLKPAAKSGVVRLKYEWNATKHIWTKQKQDVRSQDATIIKKIKCSSLPASSYHRSYSM